MMIKMSKPDFERLNNTIKFYEHAISTHPASQSAEARPRNKKQLQKRLDDLKLQASHAKLE